MRIRDIELSWFRGAADSAILDLDNKSLVVYGSNGAGKSSFVDAVEYVLNEGRIRHLAHEYSGKRQEKAIPNTHKPNDMNVGLRIKFMGKEELTVAISDQGVSTRKGAEGVAMHTWDYRRTILRQDEVAAFIHDTKGAKYSALLPLLGLHSMEVAAENLRQLAKTVESQSRIGEKRRALIQAQAIRKAIFGDEPEIQILERIKGLETKYLAGEEAPNNGVARCKKLEEAIDVRIGLSTAEQRRYIALHGVAEVDLVGKTTSVRSAGTELAGAAEPYVAEKVQILQSTGPLAAKIADAKEIQCPACGRSIAVDAFLSHVETERLRLQGLVKAFNDRAAAIGLLCDAIGSLKVGLGKIDVKAWREDAAKGDLAKGFAYLDGFNAQVLRSSCDEKRLAEIELVLAPIIEAAASASKDAPPDAKELSTDRQVVEAIEAVIRATTEAAEVADAEALVTLLTSLGQQVREEIRLRSHAVITEISADIQAMWAILHPGDAITDVRLYLPEDADKAIDISLRFFGVDQESPRLTLSESYRNSLGLCIFLAMAMREAATDRPVFLDDVVVSLDRNHRGMIVEVLAKKFAARQVILLTHDRDWYAELRQQLDGKIWAFKALLPYETPSIGIRWSHKTTTLDDARHHLKERPDSAGNDARKIMDVELATIAERLRIELPYMRGDRNDRRTGHDFLERIIGSGKKCFQRKGAKDYEAHPDAIRTFEEADRLLVSWANRASHGFDIVRPEAAKLIDACEAVLSCFTCSACGKSVWFADATGAELVQCQCGQLRWRYGKG